MTKGKSYANFGHITVDLGLRMERSVYERDVVVLISKDGQRIDSVDAWFKLAPPKGGEHVRATTLRKYVTRAWRCQAIPSVK